MKLAGLMVLAAITVFVLAKPAPGRDRTPRSTPSPTPVVTIDPLDQLPTVTAEPTGTPPADQDDGPDDTPTPAPTVAATATETPSQTPEATTAPPEPGLATATAVPTVAVPSPTPIPTTEVTPAPTPANTPGPDGLVEPTRAHDERPAQHRRQRPGRSSRRSGGRRRAENLGGSPRRSQPSAPVAVSVDRPRNTGPAEGDRSVYAVRPGDCLWIIGRAHGVDWRTIAELNRIAAPWTIYPGQLLQLR